MKLSDILQNLADIEEKWLKWYIVHIVIPMLLPICAFVLSRIFLTVAFGFNWLAGAIVSLIIALFILYLLKKLSENNIFEKFPIRLVLSFFAIIILMGASLFAAISYSLFQANIALYEPRDEIHVGKLVDFYIWYLIDMIPGLEIWKTLNVPSPIQAQGTWGGVPILAFRLFVVIPIIWLVKCYIDFVSEKRLSQK